VTDLELKLEPSKMEYDLNHIGESDGDTRRPERRVDQSLLPSAEVHTEWRLPPLPPLLPFLLRTKPVSKSCAKK